MAEKSMAEMVMDFVNKPVVIEGKIDLSRITIKLMSNNTFLFAIDGKDYSWCYSSVTLKDGKIISTRDCKRTSYTINGMEYGYMAVVHYKTGSYTLSQTFMVEEDKPYFKLYITLSQNNQILSTNHMVPIQLAYPGSYSHPMFTDVETKMLYVPYDNDMWVHYEVGYPTPSRASYDVTALFKPQTNNGLIIGALDFDFWKNGIVCSSYDARVFDVVSGISDGGTHDCLPHGYLSNKNLQSSTYVIGYYDDIRLGLEEYGRLAANNKMYHWNDGVIFGWNSYSALSISTSLDHYKEAGRFINQLDQFKMDNGVTYINLDATFGLDKSKLRKIISQMHKNGQKCGTYLAPLCYMDVMKMLPLKGSFLKFKKDIVLKRPDGTDYPPIDSKLPIDITIPEAEKDLRAHLKEIVEMGFDYLKLDFLSHGALEGTRYNKQIVSGRQALNYFYQILHDELKDTNIFISLSIAPLLPAGNGMARRSCCDSFGHSSDIRYVLNALNYSWWTNNTLYCYNDPDHTVLYQSVVDGKEQTTINEARSRYNASVISGSVMLLSDDYGLSQNDHLPQKERTALIANNAQLNEIARMGEAFKPLSLAMDNNIFYLNKEQSTYVAVFNYENKLRNFTIFAQDIQASAEGKATNLITGKTYSYQNKMTIQLNSYDSVILQLK